MYEKIQKQIEDYRQVMALLEDDQYHTERDVYFSKAVESGHLACVLSEVLELSEDLQDMMLNTQTPEDFFRLQGYYQAMEDVKGLFEPRTS